MRLLSTISGTRPFILAQSLEGSSYRSAILLCWHFRRKYTIFETMPAGEDAMSDLSNVPRRRSPPSTPQQETLNYTLSTVAGRALLAPILATVFGLIQGVRFGFGVWDYGILLAGGVLSIGFVVGALVLTTLRLDGVGESRWGLPLVLGAVIPYLLVYYLILVRGLWGLAALRHGMSIAGVVYPTAFLLIGAYGLKRLAGFSAMLRTVFEFVDDASV